MRYVKSPEDAEEVAQDVLLKVYRKIDAFRGDAALSSWIYRITFNTAMSRLRATKAFGREAEQPLLDPAGGDGAQAPDIADWTSLGGDFTRGAADTSVWRWREALSCRRSPWCVDSAG
jgi:RNA polymerase sigma-70 factor (ECF subfamily)